MKQKTYFIGTSGYAYAPWKPAFYPKDLRPDGMLHFYSREFNSVEINSSFYKLPLPAVVKNWAAQVPSDFLFAIKSPGRITHQKKMISTEKEVIELLAVTDLLGDHRGPILFQLPPFFKKDLDRLKEFLGTLPRAKSRRIAFEFRHGSWFEKDVFHLLKRSNIALCVNDADVEMPFVQTSEWLYLRLRRTVYAESSLKSWAKKIRENSSTAFVFFKHEDKATAPVLAKRLRELL